MMIEIILIILIVFLVCCLISNAIERKKNEEASEKEKKWQEIRNLARGILRVNQEHYDNRLILIYLPLGSHSDPLYIYSGKVCGYLNPTLSDILKKEVVRADRNKIEIKKEEWLKGLFDAIKRATAGDIFSYAGITEIIIEEIPSPAMIYKRVATL